MPIYNSSAKAKWTADFGVKIPSSETKHYLCPMESKDTIDNSRHNTVYETGSRYNSFFPLSRFSNARKSGFTRITRSGNARKTPSDGSSGGAFHSYCTFCDNQLDSSTYGLYCSDECRTKDSSFSTPIPSFDVLESSGLFDKQDEEEYDGDDERDSLFNTLPPSPPLDGLDGFGSRFGASPKTRDFVSTAPVSSSSHSSSSSDTCQAATGESSDRRSLPLLERQASNVSLSSPMAKPALGNRRRASVYVRSSWQQSATSGATSPTFHVPRRSGDRTSVDTSVSDFSSLELESYGVKIGSLSPRNSVSLVLPQSDFTKRRSS